MQVRDESIFVIGLEEHHINAQTFLIDGLRVARLCFNKGTCHGFARGVFR